MAASFAAASSMSACQNEPGASFSGVPIIPESTYPRNSTRAAPRISADRRVSCTRRSASTSPGSRKSSSTSPCSPLVPNTITTRWPSLAAFASVPPVGMASSSGWAWKETSVAIRSAVGLADGAGLAQLGDLVGREAPVGERLAGVLAGSGGRAGDLGVRAAEPRRRRRLGDAIAHDERLAGDVVRMGRCLGHRENGDRARVRALEDRLPLVARLALEQRREAFLERRPFVTVHLERQLFVLQPRAVEELGVELVLD